MARYFRRRSPSPLSSLIVSLVALSMSMMVRGLPVLASSIVTLSQWTYFNEFVSRTAYCGNLVPPDRRSSQWRRWK
jgi:hypothetical protein